MRCQGVPVAKSSIWHQASGSGKTRRRRIVAAGILWAGTLLFASLGPAASASAGNGIFSDVTAVTEPVPAANDTFGNGCNSGTVLSADGETALVAAPYATVGTANDAGKAYIYSDASGHWTPVQGISDPDDAASDDFGYDLALNGNGTMALVGSQAAVNGQADAGKAYLYTLAPNGTWVESHVFVDPKATAGDQFSVCDVSLSSDGQTAGIAAWHTTVNGHAEAGEVYLYSDASGSWKQVAAIPDPDDAKYDDFGAVLSISGNGSNVLVGSDAAVSGQAGAGKAYLYTLTSNGTWVESHEFDDPAATALDEFGYTCLALSYDGKVAIIAAEGTTVNGQKDAGMAYIYAESGNTWKLVASLPDPTDVANDDFGFPVAISEEGTSVLVGSDAAVNGQFDAGEAFLYTSDATGNWTLAQVFQDPAATSYDLFGDSGVALSANGRVLFIGALQTTVGGFSNAGEAYFYQIPEVDLGLALTATPASVMPGNDVTLGAVVTNTDPSVTATGVVLTEAVPGGLKAVGDNPDGGSCVMSGQSVSCTLAGLLPGAHWQPSFTLEAETAGTWFDAAGVTSNQEDPVSTNGTALSQVTVGSGSSPPSSSGSGGLGLPDLLLLTFGLFLVRMRRKVRT